MINYSKSLIHYNTKDTGNNLLWLRPHRFLSLTSSVNLLKPNDLYIDPTAQLTSRRCIYIKIFKDTPACFDLNRSSSGSMFVPC